LRALSERDHRVGIPGTHRPRPEGLALGWQVRFRNAEVYARGTVRHRDHATITLHGWHHVWMNTENTTRTMANVAFLD
jgi:hypothetical protein